MNEPKITSIAVFSETMQARLIGMPELDLDSLIPAVEHRIELLEQALGNRAKTIGGILASYLDHVKKVRTERGETHAQLEMRFLLAWVSSTPFWII